MSEIIALTRLSFAGSRATIVGAIAYFAAIHLVAIAYGLSGMEDILVMKVTLTPMIALLSLPLLGVTFAMFGFSERADVSCAATGYLPWLLRSPLPTWKLVAVPLAMKTIWVMVVVGGVALTARLVGYPLQHWIVPWIGLATLPVLSCLVTWQPFRWTYSRLVLCGLLFVPVYAWLIMFCTYAVDAGRDHPWAFPRDYGRAVFAVALPGYIAVALLAIRSVRLARYNVAGRINEVAGPFGAAIASGQQAVPADRSYQVNFRTDAKASPAWTLINYDLAKITGPLGRVLLVGWLLLVAVWCSFDIEQLSPVIFLVLGLIYPAVLVCEWMFTGRDRSFLPNLLAVSPIATATIVWTRQLTVTAIWFLSLMGAPIVIAVWHRRGAGQTFFHAWNESMELNFGATDSGWRIALVFTLFGAILVLRQTTWSVAVASMGKQRYALYMFATKFAIAFSISIWFLYYFRQFSSWEAWTEWAWQLTAESPTLMPWLLAAKLTIVALAAATLYRSRLAAPRTIVAIIVGYVVITLLCAVAFWRLMPSENVLLWHCIAVTAILMPVSRIVLAPICLASNRHQ